MCQGDEELVRYRQEGPITQQEMIALFGETMPAEAVNLAFNSSGDKTVGQIRAELREIASRYRQDTGPSDEEVAVAATAWHQSRPDVHGDLRTSLKASIAAVDALRAGQAVAWQWRSSDEYPIWETVDTEAEARHCLNFYGDDVGEVRPLFAFPVQAKPPAAVGHEAAFKAAMDAFNDSGANYDNLPAQVEDACRAYVATLSQVEPSPAPVAEPVAAKWISAESAASAIQSLQDRVRELEGALTGLTNSADGFSFRENEIRAIVGNTNWRVLRTFIDAARATLSQGQQPQGGGEC